MTEDNARDWLRERFGSRCFAAIERYRVLLLDEAARQNLIAASTLDQIWARHLADSAQLVPLAEGVGGGAWLDIGAGAGLPGLVVALASDWRVTLVEPRRLRADFLARCVEVLHLGGRVTVEAVKVERLSPQRSAVISARAVAKLDAIIAAAAHIADLDTLWLLPKGANAKSEVAAARRSWQGVFHVEQSIVDPASGIVIARGVAPR